MLCSGGVNGNFLKFEHPDMQVASFNEYQKVEAGSKSKGTQPVMKLPGLIEKLAQEAEVLIWDSSHQWYEVIDSHGFESRFNLLRSIRGKRNEVAADRPFARMHQHFVLVRGEKWAGHGSAFRPKDLVSSKPAIQNHEGTLSFPTLNFPELMYQSDLSTNCEKNYRAIESGMESSISEDSAHVCTYNTTSLSSQVGALYA
jgi:hypothetical protein